MLAFLERREQAWTRQWLEGEVTQRAQDPASRLLAVFDVFDGWFRRADFEGCSFINVMLEHPDPADPVHRASVSYLAGIRGFLEGLAREAGIADAREFAREWHILMKGSIVAAAEGDQDAARRAKRIGALLLEDATAHSRVRRAWNQARPPPPEALRLAANVDLDTSARAADHSGSICSSAASARASSLRSASGRMIASTSSGSSAGR